MHLILKLSNIKHNTSECVEKANSLASISDFFKNTMKTKPKSDLQYLFASGSKSNVKISQIPLVQELQAEWRQNCTTHTSPNKGNSINNDPKEQDTENIRKFVSHIVSNKDDTQGIYKQTPICNGENLANLLFRQFYQAPTKTKHYAVSNDDSPHIQQTQLFFTAQAASCPMLIEDQQCSKPLIEALSERCSTERPSAETKSVNEKVFLFFAGGYKLIPYNEYSSFDNRADFNYAPMQEKKTACKNFEVYDVY
uniref:Uncharacterized protein n=1 Tax=Glossina palpalis gambiensis TaxID=67801 RepID=A0A1B0BUT4_9MUSC